MGSCRVLSMTTRNERGGKKIKKTFGSDEESKANHIISFFFSPFFQLYIYLFYFFSPLFLRAMEKEKKKKMVYNPNTRKERERETQ